MLVFLVPGGFLIQCPDERICSGCPRPLGNPRHFERVDVRKARVMLNAIPSWRFLAMSMAKHTLKHSDAAPKEHFEKHRLIVF